MNSVGVCVWTEHMLTSARHRMRKTPFCCVCVYAHVCAHARACVRVSVYIQGSELLQLKKWHQHGLKVERR